MTLRVALLPDGADGGRDPQRPRVTRTALLRHPLESGPVQQSGQQDSELTCVQSDQRMHRPGYRITAAVVVATVTSDA